MRNKILLLCGTLIIFCMTLPAQQRLFTHDDLQYGGKTYSKFVPDGLSATWWGNKLLRISSKNCVAYDLKSQKGATPLADQSQLKTTKELFGLEAINKALADGGFETLKALRGLSFPFADKTWTLLTTTSHRIIIDWVEKRIVWQQQRTKGCTAEDWHKQSRNVAYVSNDNLYITTAGGKQLQLSTDGSRELVYGQSVHRNEWGISKGTYWSPDGRKLAYYRMDQSMVADYPQVDIENRIALHKPDKYPMAGMTSHEVSVGVYDVARETTVWLRLGEKKDHYFTGITWSPDNSTIYVNILNRDQNHYELWSFSATTGERIAKLYEESNDKYVEPQHPLLFLPWDNSKFILQTANEGFNHLYLYDTTGKRLRKLTDGNFVVVSVLGFNPGKKSVIITSTERHDLQHNIYAVDIESGRRTLLDNGEGFHNGTLSADGSMVLDNWSSPNVRKQYDVLATDKPAIIRLYRPDDPWQGYAVPNITSGTFKAADGVTDLYYRLITPPDFDPTKKYPTVVYLYGGPHSRLVTASWGYGYRPWEIYMAQHGYVMFVMDNRGSSERGLAFENATYRHLGDVEMQDQMRGVEFLKSLPYVDTDRMGVHGWSFGGFMTTNLMLSYPDVFKVAVAGGPVINWSLYEVMYGERYMSTPQKNPEGYKNSNLCLKAGNLKGRLKIIFGYNDPVCVPQHTLSFARACADAGTQIDLFTYPNAEHNMTGHDRVHLHEQITRYFDDFLKNK